jgi:hypothetical protein
MALQKGNATVTGIVPLTGQDKTDIKTELGYVDTVPTSPNFISNVWSGTQAQYNALGSYDNATIYFVEE